jgi:serine/threonine protein kinase
MTEQDELLGKHLGKYRITGLLGKGGMGLVYAGEDVRLKRTVAIKVLSRQAALEHEGAKRFLLEARAAARLNHANVVAVHDIGQRGEIIYIVMELVRGQSAQARLDLRGPMPWPEATRTAADVCRGLIAAHAAGLIHRDIKPANILLAADGAVKLTDFGLAKAPELLSTRLTLCGTILGTPHYMSPEQCSGENLDARTDLYSLGASYYTLLTGKPPFVANDDLKILYAHCSSPVPDPGLLVPSLPSECHAVIQKAMAKSRTDRYRTAEGMLTALVGLLPKPAAPVALPVAPPAPPPERLDAHPVLPDRLTWTKLPRKWYFLTALATLVVALITLGTNAFLGRTPPSVPKESAIAKPIANSKGNTRTKIKLKLRPMQYAGHKKDVKAALVAGGRLVTVSADGNAHVWQLQEKTPARVLNHPRPLTAAALTVDGNLLATGGEDAVVYLWETNGRQLGNVGRFPSAIHALAFSADGKYLGVGTSTDLYLVELGSPPEVLKRQRLLEMQYVVSGVAFSPDGKHLAACTYGSEAYLWDLATLTRTAVPAGLTKDLTAVAFSPDAQQLAFSSRQGSVHLWSPGQPPREVARSLGSPFCITFAPGGNLIYPSGWAMPLHVRHLASAETTFAAYPVNGAVNALNLSPDGKLVATGFSDGSARLWDIVYEEYHEK